MAASPRTPHPIQVKDSNATTGTILRIFNRTTGDTETVKFNASGTTAIDLASPDIFTNLYTVGDVIVFSIHGKYEGSNTYTVSGGSGKVTITSAASAAPGVTI